jgi:hypothetical protein
MASIARAGAYAEDDLPIVKRGEKHVTLPRNLQARAAPTDDNVPRVVGTPTLPHAVPAPVPQTYAQQRKYGPTASAGGRNIQGGPGASASSATPFQLALGAVGLYAVSTKLAGK